MSFFNFLHLLRLRHHLRLRLRHHLRHLHLLRLRQRVELLPLHHLRLRQRVELLPHLLLRLGLTLTIWELPNHVARWTVAAHQDIYLSTTGEPATDLGRALPDHRCVMTGWVISGRNRTEGITRLFIGPSLDHFCDRLATGAALTRFSFLAPWGTGGQSWALHTYPPDVS